MSQYVWTIESGSYSDYSVDGVFSSKANAELVAAQLTGQRRYNTMDIVKRTLDPLVAEIREHHRPFNVTMAMDGTVEICTLVDDPCTFELHRRLGVSRRSKAPIYVGTDTQDAVTGVVWAKDAKHAIKIANEFRAQELAK